MKRWIRQFGWFVAVAISFVAAAPSAGQTAAPSAVKSFIPARILTGRTALLDLTLVNSAGATATGVALTDNLPAGMTVAATPGGSTTCDGTVAAAPGATTVGLVGATLAAGGSCEILVTITAGGVGDLVNSDCTVSADNATSTACSPATLTVIDRPTFAKAFAPNTTLVGGTVTLTFTITNPNNSQSNPSFLPTFGNLAFVDDLPPGLVVATPNGLGGSCLDPLAPGVSVAGDVTAPAGGTAIELSSLALAADAACTVTVDVTATSLGTKENLTGPLGYTYDDGSEPAWWSTPGAAATLGVGGPDLAIAKSHVGTFPQGSGGHDYTLLVSNVGTQPSSGAVTVSDALPAGLTATAIGGSGWTSCSATPATGPAMLSCTRSDALAAAASYPPLVVTVSVAADAPAQVVNGATVAGGGDSNFANDAASDPTTILAVTVIAVPTLDGRSLALLASLLAAAGALLLRRR